MFYRSMDLKVALEWFDTARGVLTHIGYPLELCVCVATGVMRSMGKLWWESAHGAFLGTKALGQISWDRF